MLLDEYTLTQFLGKGTFGEVYLTTKKDSNFLYATKRMSKEFVEDPKYLKYFNNEITILRKLHHKNIVRLEELKKTANHYYVIMEYCNGGTLTECLEKYKNIHHSPFTEEIVQHIMRQIVSAINYIHDLRIIHRDLKLDNILVKFENETDKNQLNLLKSEVKIIDFGFAAYKTQAGLLQTAIGSPMNMDPLILKKFNMGGSGNKELGYDEKADIWSLGTLCYQMLIGHCAFDAYNMKELVSKVEEGTYKVPTNLSKEVVSFLNAMLQYNANKRLSANELARHHFLTKNVKDFQPIDLRKVSNKIRRNNLNVNIKKNSTIWSIFNEEDEKKLINIPTNYLIPMDSPINEEEEFNQHPMPENKRRNTEKIPHLPKNPKLNNNFPQDNHPHDINKKKTQNFQGYGTGPSGVSAYNNQNNRGYGFPNYPPQYPPQMPPMSSPFPNPMPMMVPPSMQAINSMGYKGPAPFMQLPSFGVPSPGEDPNEQSFYAYSSGIYSRDLPFSNSNFGSYGGGYGYGYGY